MKRENLVFKALSDPAPPRALEAVAPRPRRAARPEHRVLAQHDRVPGGALLDARPGRQGDGPPMNTIFRKLPSGRNGRSGGGVIEGGVPDQTSLCRGRRLQLLNGRNGRQRRKAVTIAVGADEFSEPVRPVPRAGFIAATSCADRSRLGNGYPSRGTFVLLRVAHCNLDSADPRPERLTRTEVVRAPGHGEHEFRSVVSTGTTS
jgi:hypothetical protein